MQEAVDSKTQLTETQYKVVRSALRSFNKVSTLVQSELISSCLIKICIKNDPNLTPSVALKEILVECVDELGESNAEYKDILVGRFFEGDTVAEMREKNRPRPLSERAFKKLQREAIIELSSILFQKEERCLSRDTTKANSLGWIRRYWKLAIIPALLVAILFLLSDFFNFSGSSPGELILSKAPATQISTAVSDQPPPAPESQATSICGETITVKDEPSGERFIASRGVSAFTMENTPGGIPLNQIREVMGTSNGVFISYYDVSLNNGGGLSFFDRSQTPSQWLHCNNLGVSHPVLINSILADENGHLWLGTDGDGVLFFDGADWQSYTSSNSGLPNDAIFELTKDLESNIWVGTADGVARYEDGDWITVFINELFQNQVSSLAFDSAGNIWAGHIASGLSLFDNEEGVWKWINAENEQLGSNNVRGIVIREGDMGEEETWVITDGGGVDVYMNDEWHHFSLADGLPSLSVHEIKLDLLNRIWIATNAGVAYYNEARWVTYTPFPSHSLDFGPGCLEENCPEDSYVWTGTETQGLTHSRLPYSDEALTVSRICFVITDEKVVCPSLKETFEPHTITATLPEPINPGGSFYFEIHVTPINGHRLVLNSTRGDFLSFTGEDEADLFGAYKLIAVEGEIQTGQTFIFSNRQNMFTAPDLIAGEDEKTFSSSWRAWMYTRYAGPEIRIEFTVNSSQE